MKINNKIFAVIIIYYPDRIKLIRSIIKILFQVEKVVLVDNTPAEDSIQENFFVGIDSDKIKLISLNENFGIAYAQNIGIEWALLNKAEYILFLDQDSEADASMVAKLSNYFDNKLPCLVKKKIAAVGPLHIDSRNGSESYFINSKFGFLFRVYSNNTIKKNNHLIVNYLISSGMLVSKDALINVRGKRSDYFIDHIDTEWCLRARRSGFILLGAQDAFLFHTLGDNVKRIWLFFHRNVHIHQPIRNYYIFRNTIFIIKFKNLSLIEYLYQVLKLIKIFIYYMMFENQKHLRFQMMLLGLKHGFKKISGKLISEKGECKVIPVTKFDPVP